MCEFYMQDETVKREVDVPGGWREFPLKKFIRGVKLIDRVIYPSIFLESGFSAFAGFAIHWVGGITPAGVCPYKMREIMCVLHSGQVKVARYNGPDKTWEDYWDDLGMPKQPHLQNYDLSVHGIII